MDNIKLNSDGSMVGKTFSGPKYKGEYPSPKEGKETYKQFYERVEKLKQEGFHLGDLSWSDWQIYLYGCPAGGGQYVQDYTIGRVPDDAWVSYNDNSSDEDNNW
jgi:hypothetical protein